MHNAGISLETVDEFPLDLLLSDSSGLRIIGEVQIHDREYFDIQFKVEILNENCFFSLC